MKPRKMVIGVGLVIIALPLVVVLIAAASIYVLNQTNGTIVSSGQKREYLLYVPRSYDRTKPTPLVISMHGAAVWPAHQMNTSRWNRLADEHGFIVVYPSGTGVPKIWHVDRGPVYDAHRWDRTVLVLPPQHSPLPMIDNDSLIQLFPRCVWADSLHREPFTDSPVVADLLERMRAIARLPVETRRTLSDLAARDKAYPVDLVPVAQHLETEAQLGSVFNEEDEATRYYAFWRMFRASAIRGVRYRQGDKSSSNRCKLAHSYIEMSKIMLDHSTEGDRFILQGDPAEAKVLVQSACGLLQDVEDELLVRTLLAEAEDQREKLLMLEQVVQDNARRFELRPRYGPLVKGRGEQSGT